MDAQKQLDEPLPAVILAAGEGSRLRPSNGGVPKPLTPLLGLTLLERVILSCREAGVVTCYVVIGCEKDKIVAHLDEIVGRTGMRVRTIENPMWEKGSGSSALAVAPYLTGPFLLLMSDIVFDPDILCLLIEGRERTSTNIMAVDRRTDEVFDLEDSTKVQLEEGRIIQYGKRITSFNVVATGHFVCQPTLFKALEKARRLGDGTIDGGHRELAVMNEIVTMDIGNRFWIDVDTGEALLHAKQVLLAELNKRGEPGIGGL